jgi:hypothetical protein
MEMKFIKTVQFTALIKAGGRLREFNFRKLRDGEAEMFTVNVVDDRGERILFGMHKENNTWRLTATQLPPWILQHEEKLAEAIEEELQRG